MDSLSKNILVIVDFTSDRKMIIRKTASLIDAHGAVIHLLYVVKTWNPFNSFELKPPFKGLLKADITTYVGLLLQLQEWKQDIEEICRNVEVKIHIQKGFWPLKTIMQVVQQVYPDLAVITQGIGNNSFLFMQSLRPNRLAKKIPCKVIIISTASPRHGFDSLKNLQMPTFQNEN